VLFDDEAEHVGTPADETVLLEDRPAPPSQGRRTSRWLVAIGVLVAVGLIVVGGAGVWVKGKVDPSGSPGRVVAFDIPRGASSATIGAKLDDAGIISSAQVFRWYLRIKGGGPFEAGQYHLHLRSSMSDVVSTLEQGPDLPPAVNLTIPEGLWVSEVAAKVGKVKHLAPAKFLALAQGGTIRSKFQPAGVNSLEGFLYPETYRVEDTEDEAVLLKRMIDTFDEVGDEVGLANAQATAGISPYQAVIVASLIESETKLDEERPKIARVIYNRLAKGIPLGIDATFYFELHRRGGALHRSELDRDTPYNTRKHAGLVPGPIAMPRRASLDAALHPADGPWLYYVLKDQTAHTFTDDYNQFLRDKRAAQQAGLIP
jgi:UPF0755 protein